MAATEETPIKLPVWRSVREAYGQVFRNFGYLLRVGWFWLLLMASGLAANFSLFSILGIASSDSEPTTLFEDFSAQAIFAFCLAVPAVRFTRLTLNLPPLEESPVTFRRICTVYGIVSLAIWVIAFAPMMIFANSIPTSDAADSDYSILEMVVAGLILVVVLLFALLPIGRFSLVLPSLAIDAEDTTLLSAWRRTSGNSFRLMVAMLATLLPFIAFALAKYVVVERLTSDFTSARLLWLAAYNIIDGFASFLPVALFAIAYRELVMKKAAG